MVKEVSISDNKTYKIEKDVCHIQCYFTARKLMTLVNKLLLNRSLEFSDAKIYYIEKDISHIECHFTARILIIWVKTYN